jgi:DHA1 family multidrug resistance protein-like MFS transporter
VLLEAVVPLVAVNILYFAVMAVSIPLTQNLVAEHARQAGDSNLTMGFFNGVRSLGGIAGSLAAGLLYSVGPKLPFVLGLAAFVLATAMAAVYYRRCRALAAPSNTDALLEQS